MNHSQITNPIVQFIYKINFQPNININKSSTYINIINKIKTKLNKLTSLTWKWIEI